MSEFESGKSQSEIESGRQLDTRDFGLRSQPENSERISQALDIMQTRLVDYLTEREAREKILNIPVLFQEGRNSEIACARMALIYLKEKDPGEDGFTKIAKGDRSLEEFVNPAEVDSALKNEFGIEREIFSGSVEKKAAELSRALIDGKPVQLKINENVLHHERQKPGARKESVLAKGYRVRGRELVIVANDPTREKGREIEINLDLLEKALEGPVYVYSRR